MVTLNFKHALNRDSNGVNKRLIVVTRDEIKSISLNFCELRKNSCEECVKNNNETIYSTNCYWYNNMCVSEAQLEGKNPNAGTLRMCKENQIMINKETNIVDSSSKVTLQYCKAYCLDLNSY